MLATVLGYLTTYGPTVFEILGALTLLVGLVAKLTPTDKDDRLAAFLGFVHDKLGFFVAHPPLAVKRAGAAVQKAGAVVVVDHRRKS